jgi:SET domain-containing protein
MSENFLIEEDNAPDTYVKKSNVSGLGLYAIKDFRKGDVVFDYNHFEESWFKIKFEDLTEEQIGKNWYIMIDNEWCFTNNKYSKFSYINHSRDANCKWLVKEKLILADKNIDKDEELFIDYRLEERPNRVEFPNWI